MNAAGRKKRPVESYDHRDKKRANNPPVGLVTPETDRVAGQRKTYEYDPHIGAVHRHGSRMRKRLGHLKRPMLQATYDIHFGL